MIVCGSRSFRMAAASPIAAAGVLGLALEHQVGVLHLGQAGGSTAARCARPGDHEHPLARERLQPVVGGAQQGAARTRQVVEELGSCCPRQRPEAGPHAAGRNHRNETAQYGILH